MSSKSFRISKLYQLIMVFLFIGQYESEGQTLEPISLGYRFSLYSDSLEEERHCLISLPDSYQENLERTYPILILLDGYTHFKPVVGIVQFMSSRYIRNNLSPEMIVVAIENVDRERDFTFTKIKTKRPNTMGGGQKFLSFIQSELIPYIDRSFRTERNRTLIGHSLGGLLSINAFLQNHNSFDNYLVIDPSIWWDSEIMNDKIEDLNIDYGNKKLYIATANGGERNIERNKARHDLLFELLENDSGGRLQGKIEYFHDEDHRSVPLIATYRGLRYFFNSENSN